MKTTILLRNMLALAVTSAVFNSAMACGPFFPLELTSARNITLNGLIEGNFYYEAGQLSAKPSRLLSPDPHMGSGFETETSYVTPERHELETLGYSGAQQLQFEQARAATNAAAAFAAANGLPLAHQHYLAGAVAFLQQDFSAAREHFNAIVELQGNNDRLLWAHYMLAKTEYAEHGVTPQALASFATLRELGYQGVDDPHGLALSSLGDQAFWYLQDVDDPQRPFAVRFTEALALYAEQAAQEMAQLELAMQRDEYASLQYNTGIGQTSLLLMARRLLRNAEERAQVIDDPQVQQLLMSYLFARSTEADSFTGENAENDYALDTFQNSNNTADAGQQFTRAAVLDEVMAAVERGNTSPAFADRVAAVLYRAGDFDRAGRFAMLSESAIAYWVRAKLALRAGDAAAAAQAYAVAARSFPDQVRWVEYGDEFDYTSGVCRVQAESATLALSRGDYLQAMTLFQQAGDDFYNDLARIAERVLTVDELQQFVDSETTAPTAEVIQNLQEPYYVAPVDTRLRALLARRLMREGDYEKALPYFDSEPDRDAAARYAVALTDAQKQKDIAKAESLNTAAQLAKQHGMEILGSELEPDFKVYDGAYSPVLETDDDPLLTSQDELQRSATNAVVPFARYSYRYVATDLLEQAAALLPERSQAYAAVLCDATNWMINLDLSRAQALYGRYIDKGAYVSFGSAFGRNAGCEEPDFARAQQLQDQQTWQHRKQLLKRLFPFAMTAAGASIIAAAAVFWRRRKTP